MDVIKRIKAITDKLMVKKVRDKDLDKKDFDDDLNKELKLHRNPKKLPPRMDLRKHQIDDKDLKIE